MYPPSLIYEVARQKHAEDLARAEAWRSRRPDPGERPARPARRAARPRRRFAGFAGVLVHRAQH